jgi:hypothetical protein
MFTSVENLPGIFFFLVHCFSTFFHLLSRHRKKKWLAQNKQRANPQVESPQGNSYHKKLLANRLQRPEESKNLIDTDLGP